MENINLTKVIRTGSSLGVVIPVNVIRAMGWERGDILVYTFISDNTLGLKRLSDQEIKTLREINRVISIE